MLPQYEDDLKADFVVENQPDETYLLELEKERVMQHTEGLTAIRQAIYKVLSTERYHHAIYSWNYGVELADLIGKPIPYVYSEIKERITDALMQDKRMLRVGDFSFAHKGGVVSTTFTAESTAGTLQIEKEVKV